MSQWGQARIFRTEGGSCRAVPHVVGPAFAPALDSDPIDMVVALDVFGDAAEAQGLAQAFVGRAYRDWLRA